MAATAAVVRGFLSPICGGHCGGAVTATSPAVVVSRARSTSSAAWRPAPGTQASDSAGMDTIINDLKESPDVKVLTLKVSKCVQQVAQPAFFLRLAELAENAEDDKERVALEKLALAVTGVLETLVEFAEEKMDDSSSLLQIVVTSAAEKNGEFLVPLSEERLTALRQSIKIHRDQLDNNFLATVQAWMDKSSKEEGMEGMVVILQKILQMYASQEILLGSSTKGGSDGGSSGSESGRGFGEGADAAAAGSGAGGGASNGKRTPAQLLLGEILVTDADKWDGMLTGLSVPGRGMTGGVSKEGLLGAIQVAVEKVILQQENGSMAQRVQAEFLSELCKRIEATCPERPPGPGMLE
ncbi:unnamed protein product [Pylaiella littoralis]